jgi:hypothetical protein
MWMMIMKKIIIIIIIIITIITTLFREVQGERIVPFYLCKKCAAWESPIHGIPDLSHAARAHLQQLL